MGRIITGHEAPSTVPTYLEVVADGPGPGGASHHYAIKGRYVHGDETIGEIHFQEGPIGENGVNGLTNEVLLTIVADRLRSFNAGDYRCRENACALTHIEEALMWLHKRTDDRNRRGVEGTSAV